MPASPASPTSPSGRLARWQASPLVFLMAIAFVNWLGFRGLDGDAE